MIWALKKNIYFLPAVAKMSWKTNVKIIIWKRNLLDWLICLKKNVGIVDLCHACSADSFRFVSTPFFFSHSQNPGNRNGCWHSKANNILNINAVFYMVQQLYLRDINLEIWVFLLFCLKKMRTSSVGISYVMLSSWPYKRDDQKIKIKYLFGNP